MKTKLSLSILAIVCATQVGFALPTVEDAGDVLPSADNNSGYLSSAPVQALEMASPVAQKTSTINDDLSARIRTLEDDVQSLKGQVDELQHSLRQSQKEQAVLIEALSKKIAAMPVSVPAALPVATKSVTTTASMSATKAAPVAAVAVATKTSAPTTPEAQEKATYDAAYSLVTAKAYADAIEAFKGYMTIYPEGKYVAQANYWLGELNASQQLYPVAIKYLEVVVNQYPKSTKVPDAMLKLGIINKRLGNDAKAQSWFARVTKEYPQSTAAQSAKEYIVN